MYQDYFRLTGLPFSIAPDPRFLYMSAKHREALAHLLYGVGGDGGLVLLTGEIGTGKTTLCRSLLEQIHDRCDLAIILNPKLGVEELLETICTEFRIAGLSGGRLRIKTLVDAINFHLLGANAIGRRAVLIIDEAQNLEPAVLEQLRLLTNLETNTRKLLQIVLIGQPELNDILARPEMRQVSQRVVARYHLAHLTRDEVAAYVNHRLRVAGTQAPLFPPHLAGTIYRATQGVPRLINLLCDRALLGTYLQGQLQVSRRTLRQAAAEVFGASAASLAWQRMARRPAWLGAVGAVAAAALLPFAPAAWPDAGMTPPSAAAARTATEPVRAAPRFASLRWPAETAARAESERLAFRDLLALYGIDAAPDAREPACAAAAPGLRCVPGAGTLTALRRLNRPAVLTLVDGDGAPGYHVAMIALDDQAATLSFAGERRQVRLADLVRAWTGDFTVIEPQPPEFKSPLSFDCRGPEVARLRQDLARLMGGTAGTSARFDEDLRQQVKKFQAAEGLVADGVAGALTMIRLNMLLDRSLPRLTAAAPGRDVLHS